MTATPEELGRYKVIRLLGRGGMGEVYLATSQGAAGFEKPVVLKVLRPKFGRSVERTERLLREAMIGARLDHPHIVQALDLGEADGRWFAVFEYVRGFTLGHLIVHAQGLGELLPIATVVHVVRAVASALEAVHGAGLTHRDVSPSNVLLGVDGRVKLSDFGVAGLADEEDAGHVVGKPPYLPPEAFTGGRPGADWDVYALGVVLWEALAARRAFEGADSAQIAEAVRRGAAPIAGARPDCPAALADVVDRAVAKDPARRFAAAADLRAALDAAWPRTVEDGDRLHQLLEETYARDSFVGLYGGMPATAPTITAVPALEAPRTNPDGDTADVPAQQPLRFGLSPALGAAMARAHGDRLAARLTAATGRAIRPMIVADYRALVDCLVHGEVDLAWTPPAVFVEAAERGAGAVVVARRRGRITYESAIIVRADSPFTRLADLRGQSMAWVDRESAGGYLFAVAEVLRELGQPTVVFKRQHFHGSHQAVCEAVAEGWAAAGATYAVRDAQGAVEFAAWIDLLGPRADEVRPIAFSRPIPSDNVAHRPGLPAETVELIADALVGIADDAEGRLLLHDIFSAEGFVRPTGDVYDQVRTTLRAARQAL